jgi:FolB domain-containing protein
VDEIHVRGVRAEGRHGYPHEREKPQTFLVDVTVGMDQVPAARSDDLDDIVDYGEVIREIRDVVENESFMLIESVAQSIADRVLKLGAERVKVRVAKPKAAKALGAEQIYVEIERGGSGGRQRPKGAAAPRDDQERNSFSC